MVDRTKGLGHVEVGDHLCWTYEDDAAFWAASYGYIETGLEERQRVACYLPAVSLEDICHRLDANVPGALDAMEAGALVLGATRDVYLGGDGFDPVARLQEYAHMASQAITDGFAALRVIGEATEVLNDPGAREGWPAYELRADLLVARVPMIAVCAYDARRCDPEVLAVLHAVHGGSRGNGVPHHLFRVHAGRDGSLSLSGELDFACSETVASVAGEAARDVCEPVLDVTELRFIDVAGMRAVVHGLRAMADAHQVVRIRGAGTTFKRMWAILSCDRQVEAEFEPV